MLDLSVCMAYYDNLTMLHRHLDALERLPIELRSRIEFVVCDDGSPRWPAFPHIPCNANLKIYRIGVDIRWNQDAARNVCVKHSAAPWLLLTDIDHFIPKRTLEACASRKFDPQCVYRFTRETTADRSMKSSTPYKPHPNSWLMTREMFEAIGGYDERFAGYYGTDADFRDRVRKNARSIVMLKETILRVPREVIPDASTTTYQRKAPEDRRLGQLMAERAIIPDWTTVRFRFPYSQVYECSL